MHLDFFSSLSSQLRQGDRPRLRVLHHYHYRQFGLAVSSSLWVAFEIVQQHINRERTYCVVLPLLQNRN